MTTWLMQNISENQAIAQEIRNRMHSLRHPEAPRHWAHFLYVL